MSDKLTISRIAQLRVLVRSRLPKNSASRQFAAPCRNSPSCMYHRHNRCWFQHGTDATCPEVSAQHTHRTSVKYYDLRTATACAAPVLQYNATAILHDNQHAFIATSCESKQVSSVDDDEIPELQDSSSGEESSAQLHPSDSTQRIRANVYDCQVTSVSTLFNQAQHYENPKHLSHNACEKHGTL